MNPDIIIDLARQALQTVLVISIPILGVALLTGVTISMLQSMTQMQDQSIGTIARLIAVLIVLLLCMPWLVEMMMGFGRETIEGAASTTMDLR